MKYNRLPFITLLRIRMLHIAVKISNRLAEKINDYLEHGGCYGCEDTHELMSSKFVKGVEVERGGERYLQVIGYEDAKQNKDGVFCHPKQVCEDWYTGELYFKVSKNRYWQIFYNTYG